MTYAWRTAPAVVEAIRERYLAGDPVKVIVADVGVDARLVDKYTRDLPSRVPATEAKLQEGIRRVAAGECIGKVARELRVGVARLQARVRAASCV